MEKKAIVMKNQVYFFNVMQPIRKMSVQNFQSVGICSGTKYSVSYDIPVHIVQAISNILPSTGIDLSIISPTVRELP